MTCSCPSPQLRDSIIGSSSAICDVERRYAPAMAAYRLAVAKEQGLPGILPGVPPEVCSTSMIGSSLVGHLRLVGLLVGSVVYTWVSGHC